MKKCLGCGTAVVAEDSLRCRKCNGRYQAELAAHASAEQDREILRMRDVEHLSGARIAARIGVSRARAYAKVRDARRREAVRRREDYMFAVEALPATLDGRKR